MSHLASPSEPQNTPSPPAAYLTPFLLLAVMATLAVMGLAVVTWAPAFAAAAPTASPKPRPTQPAGSQAHLAPFFTPEVRHWEADILRWAQRFHLDPNLVATVMQIESCGDPKAVSSAGARGLFQVMPYHFKDGEDPFNPNTNAQRGLAYLRQAWQRSGGDVRLTLAGYNGGLGVIGLDSSAWPAETRRYVQWGAPIYQDAKQGKQNSQALQTWLQHGGASLCRQAHQRLGMP